VKIIRVRQTGSRERRALALPKLDHGIRQFGFERNEPNLALKRPWLEGKARRRSGSHFHGLAERVSQTIKEALAKAHDRGIQILDDNLRKSIRWSARD